MTYLRTFNNPVLYIKTPAHCTQRTMKFGATWKKDVASWPDTWVQSYISYTAWKKTRLESPEALEKRLMDDCRRCDEAFVNMCKARCKSPSSCSWLRGMLKTPVTPCNDDPYQLLQFAQVNQQCVYKICKRLKKRGIWPDAMNTWRHLHETPFAFLGGFWRQRLALDADGWVAWDACPVCLGDRHEVSAVYVLSCGHTLCLDCTKQLWGAHKGYGILRNVLMTNEITTPPRCPVCRAQRVLGGARERCIWPPNQARALSQWTGGT